MSLGPAQRSVPVTVIGGYLGAGKTTLVNSVLSGSHGQRIAVLVNDFGEVNIDASLIATRDGSTIELTNGCACCSISDGLGEAFHAVGASNPPFDHVVLEASGVADPTRLADWATLPGFRVDGVVVLVDAETVRSRATDRYSGTTVLRQIAGADLLVVTKADLVSADVLAATIAWLELQRPGVPLVVSRGRVPYEVITGIGADRSTTDLTSALPTDDHATSHRSLVVRTDEPFDEVLLRAVFASSPEGLVRAKGLVKLQQRPGRFVLHVVGARVALTPDADPAATGTGSTVVCIGVGPAFDPSALETKLRSAAGY